MLIGTWNISEAEARQWNVTPGFHSIKNDSEWVRGSPIPAIFKNEIGFKPLKVAILVKTAGGRTAILERCSSILARLLEPTELTLDGFEHKFFGVLTKYTHEETAMRRWHKLILEFDCYEFGTEVVQTASGVTDLTVMNTGNILSPIRMEITPQVGAASITLNGICRDAVTGKELPVVINNLEAGKTVVLDGYTGLISQNEELKKDIEIWSLPTLLPGTNTIRINNNRMDIAVRFHPRFM